MTGWCIVSCTTAAADFRTDKRSGQWSPATTTPAAVMRAAAGVASHDVHQGTQHDAPAPVTK